MNGEKCLYMKVFKKRGFGDTRIRDKYLKYLKEFKIYIKFKYKMFHFSYLSTIYLFGFTFI